jgi:lipopolysaccharide export system protein LptA
MRTHYLSKSFHFLLLALLLSMANSVVQAEKADFDKPTNVEAIQMSYDEKNKSIFLMVMSF